MARVRPPDDNQVRAFNVIEHINEHLPHGNVRGDHAVGHVAEFAPTPIVLGEPKGKSTSMPRIPPLPWVEICRKGKAQTCPSRYRLPRASGAVPVLYGVQFFGNLCVCFIPADGFKLILPLGSFPS